MSYEDLRSTRARLVIASALARIQVAIERAAHAALKALGSAPQTQARALGLIEAAQAAQTDLETDLKQVEAECAACLTNGLHPFNEAAWARTCQSTAQSYGAGAQFYKNRHAVDRWFREQAALIAPEARSRSREIYQLAKAEALGALPFNSALFEAACRAASSEAAKGCGLSDVLWSKTTTSAIEGFLCHVDDQHIAQARDIAKQAGWLDLDEIRALNDMIEEEGLCGHGLDPDCCPAGCGDL